MKKTTLLKSMLLLCALVVGSNSLWADDDPKWSHEFASPEAISDNAITVGGATWSVSTTVGAGSPTIDKGNSYTKYCLKFGTGASNCYSNVTFTTNYFKDYNVKSVTVQVLHNASKSGTLTVTQGSTTIGTKTQTHGTTWTDMTVNTTTGSGGNLSISYSPTSCAVNIHSITVVYTAGGSSDPSIDVTPTSKTENYDTEEGTFTVTLNKIDTGVGTEVVFYESDGTTPAVSNPYDWFDASINGDGNVAYTLTENTDPVNSRTAYFKVYGKDEDEGNDVYSDLITLTQSKYTVDFATLPFDFDGGKGELPTGMSHTGLGSNYDNSPKLKFDTTGDELILKIKGHLPQQLSFYIKGNGFSGGTFKVQWSINGIDYTDLASYTSITDGNKEIDLSSCVNLRYIKWVYTEKSSGNVALGNIAVSQQTVAITPAKTYTTLTSAYNLDFTGIEGLKAYIATSISAGSVQMTQVNKVPAGTGLVLKATTPESPVNVPVFDGTSPDDVSSNKMTGSATATTEIAANAGYILSNGVFQPASAGTLAAGKAYLAIAVSAHAHALELDFGNGDVTAINKVEAAKKNAGEYFNLAGQRVAQPTKGLYIVNGKKVVLK